jgi:hypothetical protein
MVIGINRPAAGHAGFKRWLTTRGHLPGVPEPGRSTAYYL